MSNDARIKELLKTVESKRAELGKQPKLQLETNGVFKYEDGNHFNINTVTNKQVFVSALTFLIERSSSNSEACERLGVEAKDTFKWNGFTVEEYEGDFKQRIALVDWDVKKKQLTELEKKLGDMVSDEGKTEMELDDIAALLK